MYKNKNKNEYIHYFVKGNMLKQNESDHRQSSDLQFMTYIICLKKIGARVNFQCRLSYSTRTAPVYNRTH